MGYLCHKWPRICSTCRKHFPVLSSFTRSITRLTRRVPLVEQELLTLPEHLNSPPVFSGFRVTRSLALCVCFVDRCLSLYTFSFGHCFVCSSLIYRLWLPPFDIFKLFLHACLWAYAYFHIVTVWSDYVWRNLNWFFSLKQF